MSEVTIGKCSICGGEVTVIAPYFGIPTPSCKKCGAFEDRVKNLRTIPMKKVQDFRDYQHESQQDYFGIKKEGE